MVDTVPRSRPGVRMLVLAGTPTNTRLGAELREMAEDLAGHIDRDELSTPDEALLADALEAAVAAALPAVLELLDHELTPRIEALPLATRLTLARARRRLEFGID